MLDFRHCGVEKPSWSELYHFVSFLNKQLEDFEHSIFCSSDLSRDLPGFPAFVLKFLIHMSRVCIYQDITLVRYFVGCGKLNCDFFKGSPR